MGQHAFHLQLLPGGAGEYIRLHSPVPPAVTDQLDRAGVGDYSIFVDGDHVFGVFRYLDEQRLAEVMDEDVAPEWTAAVIALTVQRRTDPWLHVPAGLARVFRFDGAAVTARALAAEVGPASGRDAR